MAGKSSGGGEGGGEGGIAELAVSRGHKVKSPGPARRLGGCRLVPAGSKDRAGVGPQKPARKEFQAGLKEFQTWLKEFQAQAEGNPS
jgi:hypothetical protein